MRKITNEHDEFLKAKGIDIYYNDTSCYITIARGDTWETAVKQIVSTIQKY